jgi:hypothetical protein
VSNSDSFIDEVTEEVRRDRLYGYLRRYGWIAVLLVLLIVGGAAWNEWRKAQARADAQAFGDALLAALEADDPSARLAAMETIPADGAQVAILRLLTASLALEQQDRGTALAELAALADDNSMPQSYRQLATLKRVIIGGADLPLDEREAALSALAQPGVPFRPLAMEQLAVLRIEVGDRDGAVQILRDIANEPEATAGLRRRASQLMVVLGAEPAPAG